MTNTLAADEEHCGRKNGSLTMPLFEYICEDCDSEFELLVNRSDKPVCPKCQSQKLNKLISAAAGRVPAGGSLPIAGDCPPPEAGPCSPHCCRLPQ